MKTLDNIMHAKLIVRGETLRGIFDKSENPRLSTPSELVER